MAKTRYVCTSCGYEAPRWMGQCPDCKEWSTLEEEIVQGSVKGNKLIKGGFSSAPAASVTSLGKHSAAKYPRNSSGLEELDRVLGGGIVPGSVILLSADPGAGKSTLSSMVIDYLAGIGKKVLYVAGEESGEQIRLRTDRMSLKNSDNVDVASETEVNAICSSIAGGYDFAVVDSIQTLWDQELSGAPGSVSIVKQVGQSLVRAAKDNGCAILLIGHVTKDGNLAGPRNLEHMVDVVLSMEGERTQAYRIVRCQKNRFGATHEIGVFEMTSDGLQEITDPTSLFLQEHDQLIPGSVVCPTIEGTRPMLVEVQALAQPVAFQNAPPARRVRGIDKNRLDMLIAVLQRHSKLSLTLGAKDVYVNVSGGLKVDEPAFDLAVCVAIASAASGRPVKPGTAVFGEVSLLGEVRPVGGADRRKVEANKLGWPNLVAGPGQGDTSVKYLSQALYHALEVNPAKKDKSSDSKVEGKVENSDSVQSQAASQIEAAN